jgi:hypothetical protein
MIFANQSSRIIDISQNVDRVDNAPLGISGCLTPMGTNYLTDSSRPVNGYECLILQGIPVDEVSFTSETDAELKNLAGNAMSSTIVGPALLSALIVGAAQFEHSNSSQVILTKRDTVLIGEEHLKPWTSQSKRDLNISFIELLNDAEKSSRKCFCEGQTFVSKHDILQCQDCGQTLCERCKGSPQHIFGTQYLSRQGRMTPHDFFLKWSQIFPLTLRIESKLKFSSQYTIDSNIRQTYSESVTNAFAEPFTFQKLHRKATWSVCYESRSARLELVLSKNAPEWQLFVKPSSLLPANAKLRQIFSLPIARSSLTEDFYLPDTEMKWQLFVPSSTQANLKISGTGEEVGSWRAKIGLEEYSKEKVWATLEINVDNTDSKTPLDVAGRYALISNCGTACGSLYKRAPKGAEKPVYLFLDPNPVGPHSEDAFVFSFNCHRLEPGEARSIIAKLGPSWRPWGSKHPQTLTASISGFLAPLSARLIAIESDVQYRLVAKDAIDKIARGINSCSEFSAMLTTEFNAHNIIDRNWKTPTTIKLDNKQFFDKFSWVLRKAKDLVELTRWTSITDNSFLQSCTQCAPHPPVMKWTPDAKSRIPMHEDHIEAANYEAAMKSRPQPFAVTVTADEVRLQLKIGLNFRTLAHRAAAQIRKSRDLQDLSVAWNLDTCFVEPAALTLPKFNNCLKGNDDSPAHESTLRMRLPLHNQQLRSLTWMVGHEQSNGVPFSLQHVEEALLPTIGWKVEVRATATTRVKGGVLADQP